MRMNPRRIIIFLFAVALPLLLTAQEQADSRDKFVRAERNYQTGLFQETLDILYENSRTFKQSKDRQNMYRLMALCYLALDSARQTEQFASLLLKENPNYTSMQDPIRFEELIEHLRSGRTMTITTASSQSESLAEAPVPVTIITAEMIEMLGYNKNLNQILAAYVPGVSEVTSTTLDNIAIHGAYSANQENILIMENGHRLNARSTNLGRTDYAINTQKIDHIEVLRGPASSLYGNVALTAVVNIITKDGTSVDGLSAQYGYGSFNTHKADFLAGGHFMNTDVLVWASVYSSVGDKHFISSEEDQALNIYRVAGTPEIYGGNVYLNKYTEKPSYDVGVQIRLDDFKLMLSRKSGKKTSQYSMMGHIYDYDLYRWFDGNKPGYSVEENHIDLSYDKRWGDFSLNAAAYGDWYSFNDYSVASDSMTYAVFNEDGSPAFDEQGQPITTIWRGAYQVYDWKEMTIGATLRGDYNYTLGNMRGNILAGVQFEFFSLYDTYSVLGSDYDAVQMTASESNNTIKTGHENSISFYVQDKHYLTPKLILNVGGRFDSKYRADGVRINALSPRLAFIYTPSSEFGMKLSYSRSFVDAPYFYRLNTDNSYRGADNLKSEYLTAVQWNVMGAVRPLNLKYDVNLFYNRFSDIMYNKPSGELTEERYRNSGRMETVGAEFALQYDTKRLKGNMTASYTRLLYAKDYHYKGHHVYSVPDFISNAQLMYDVLGKSNHQLWLSANVKFTSKFYMRTPETQGEGGAPSVTPDDKEFAANAILDLGAHYKMGKHLSVRLDCENVFNKTSYISGATLIPLPWYKPGRTIMASVKYKL